MGIPVCLAKTVEEAKACLQKEKPSTIFLDLLLEGCIAYDVVAEARRLYDGAMPRIVVVSAMHGADQVAQEMKADHFLPKPFGLDNLMNLVV